MYAEEGLTAPESLRERDKPLPPECTLFARCFLDCSTERQVGMGMGPIPWSAVRLWCIEQGARDLLADVWYVVHTADAAMLEKWSERLKSRRDG